MSTTSHLSVVSDIPPEPDVPRLTWNDFAPGLDPRWNTIDMTTVDEEDKPAVDVSEIVWVTVDGVDYVTDRYLLVPADLAPEGKPGFAQLLMPAHPAVQEAVENLVRSAQLPPTPEHEGVSPFHLALARRMDWDLEPVADRMWRATRDGQFVGLVCNHKAGLLPDADLTAIETIYRHLGNLHSRITRYGAAALLAQALTNDPASLRALRVVGADELLELAYRRTEVAAQHEQIDSVLALHKPERSWLAWEESDRAFATREEAQAYTDDQWAKSPEIYGGLDKPAPYEFTYCVECAAVQRDVADGDAVADAGGYGSAVEWPCATAAALGVTA